METEKQKTIITRDDVMDGLEFSTVNRMLNAAIKLLSPVLDDSSGWIKENVAEASSVLDGMAIIMRRTSDWTMEVLDGRVSITRGSFIAELEL